jgi:mitochondrial distribution and morphology protein 31
MACRAIANCTQRSGGLTLRRLSRGTNGAALDRYTTIRSFFSMQSESPEKRSGVVHVRTYVTGIHPRPINMLLKKNFHTGPATGKQLDRGTPDLSRAPDKPPSKSEMLPSANEAPLAQNQRTEHSTSDPLPRPNLPEPPPSSLPPLNLDNYSRFFRRLALSLPHLHRPTRDDFLNVTSGFWQRARIRFKWFTIKSFRKFNADDISAFVTWFLMSQTLWILVGT